MKKPKKQRVAKVSIEEIEERALRGEDVNAHFTRGRMMPSKSEQVQRVNVDFGNVTLTELDQIAAELNVSRQAVIKLFVQREVDQHFLAKMARKQA
ncbi:MAG: CopG family transcriptional regulator [Proteobacteria bacterium]|nr:CopG family transcriptional regulator [Pseudomonadota bacterium]